MVALPQKLISLICFNNSPRVLFFSTFLFIIEYQTYRSNNSGLDYRLIFRDFPEILRADISLHLHRDIFKLPVFQTASESCKRFISLHTNDVFVTPSECLIHVGDQVKAIYLVVSGSLEVIKNKTVIAILGKGDLFGLNVQENTTNVSLNEKSSSDVKALSYCILQSISRDGVEKMMETYPEYTPKFCKDLMADYSCSLWGNEEDISESEENCNNNKSDHFRRFSAKSTDTVGSDVSYNLIPAVTRVFEQI